MTEKSLINIYHVEQHENITISLSVLQQSLCSAFFQTLINLNVHTGMAVNHTLMTVSTMITKDLMQMAIFLIYILNINILFWHCKKHPITFEHSYNSVSQQAPAFIGNLTYITAILPFREHLCETGWRATMRSLQACTHMSPFTI